MHRAHYTDFEAANAPVAPPAERTLLWTLTPDGMVEHTTARAFRAAARSRRRGQAQRWRSYWPEEYHATIDRAVAKAASGNVSRFRLVDAADGAPHTYWETVVSPVHRADGVVDRLIATSSDVTLEVERESVLNTVVTLLPSPLAVKDVESGRYILWNRAAEEVFDLDAAQVLGRATLGGMGGPLGQALAQAESTALSTGERQLRSIVTGGAEDARYFDLQTLASFDDFGARHLISLSNDVTDRRRAADALQELARTAEEANEAKSRFLANMSHEFRTPMNGIVAAVDILRTRALDASCQELVGIIGSSGAVLERLLADVFDLAAIEAGEVGIRTEPFHIGEIARQAASLARMGAVEKGLALTVTVADDADHFSLGDPVRLAQVLANLLSNAVKFTDQGEVRVEVARTPDGDVSFTVADTGIGLSDDLQCRIFERFRQADSSTTRRHGGLGLGLAISRELVCLLGGRLSCASQVGKGARFCFDLPMPPAIPEPEETWSPAQQLNVLVVDDHPTNRRLVELLLGHLGKVVAVNDGQQALDAYGRECFDLVLMDLQMPVMDGLTAVREIRATEARDHRARMPIVMISANTAAADLIASRQAGADLHIGKPITADKLFAAVQEVLA